MIFLILILLRRELKIRKSLYHDLGFTLSYYDVNKLNELFSDKKDKIKYRCYGIMTKSDFLNRLMEDKKGGRKERKKILK